MTKIYEKFPEIIKIKAKVINKKIVGSNTYLILDKTIFNPNNEYLLEDRGCIDDHKLINVELKNNKIIHKIEGKINKGYVDLSLNKDIRYKNLTYNTAFMLIKIILSTYYIIGKFNFVMGESEGKIDVYDFYDEFDKNLIEDLLNTAINSALLIGTKDGITTIAPLGRSINNLITFDNTYKLKHISINDYVYKDNTLSISFRAG